MRPPRRESGVRGTPPRPVHVVGIAGPSGCGKSTLAQSVAARADGLVFGLDAYYRDQSHVPEALLQVDVPEAIDVGLAAQHLRELAAGNEIEQPVYDFTRHARRAETRVLAPSPLVVVEGLFALYWMELRELMQTRVFVDLDHEECLRRRIERDVRERGRALAEITATYEQRVRPMYERHVARTRDHAHVILDGSARIDQLTERVIAFTRRGAE